MVHVRLTLTEISTRPGYRTVYRSGPLHNTHNVSTRLRAPNY